MATSSTTFWLRIGATAGPERIPQQFNEAYAEAVVVRARPRTASGWQVKRLPWRDGTVADVRYPSLYQMNTRVWLTQRSRDLGRAATLDDVGDDELDRLASLGFDWLWLLTVWQTGPKSLQVSRQHRGWRREFEETLSDLREEDIGGSGFAVARYEVHEALGGDAALARLRERMRRRELRLMLDFIPNHTGLDHHWVEEHPEYYVAGTEVDLLAAPENYTSVGAGNLILAHGRDPNFAGWTDTLQLNYGNPATQDAMRRELVKIAGQCDGLRCDMAMLVLPDIFEGTWGIQTQPFWPAAIGGVHQQVPDFCFMAEVYWDLEWVLQQQGFDYTYDKRLYDRLLERQARPVREHLGAGLDYQIKLARFLENHDEQPAAAAFPTPMHKAAAVITYLAPGMRFFHQGQFQGRTKRITPHLVRAPDEPVNQELAGFYDRLLGLLRLPAVRQGEWQLLQCDRAWERNWTSDCFLACAWQHQGDERLLVAVNYAGHQSQCFVRLPFMDLGGSGWRLTDQLSEARFVRDGDDLQRRGLFLDMAAWQASAFCLQRNT